MAPKKNQPAAQSRGASPAAMQAFVASNPNSRTAQAAAQPARQTSVQQITKQNNLSQNLRAAGAGSGVLSNKELLKISQVSGGDTDKVLEKAVGKGLMIGSNVVNQYQKGKYSTSSPGYEQYLRMIDPSKSSPILNQIRNAGRLDKGSALFIGSKGSTATTLPRGMGSGMKPQPVQSPVPTAPALPTQTGTTAEEPIVDPILPEEKLPEDKVDPGSGMMAGGGAGAAGANKLGRAKSRLRQLGIYGRGTGLLGRGLQYGNALNK